MGQSRLFNDAAAARRERRALEKRVAHASWQANRLREAIEYLRSAAGALGELDYSGTEHDLRREVTCGRDRIRDEAQRLLAPFRFAATAGGWRHDEIEDVITGR